MKAKRPAYDRPTFCMVAADGLDPGTTYPRHTHGDWELLVVTEGAMQVMTGNKAGNGVVGSVFIRPAEVPHQEWCTSTVRLELLILFFKYPQGCGPRLPAEAFDGDGHIRDVIRWLMRFQGILPHRHRVLDGVVEGLMMECLGSRAVVKPDRLQAVLHHIETHLTDELSLKSLAQVASMSRSQFAYEFHRQTGLSPMSYVRKVRLDRACTLLGTTDTVLREVARSTGFRDEFEFSRVFRRVMGVTPGSLRKKRD